MPLTNPRIIIVDENQGIYNIVKASMELLARRPRLIETRTGDDAMTELRISPPDLLVTAHSLPGKTNGPILALQAKREQASLPVIVLGGESDPEMDEETLSQSPFQYLRRPVQPEVFIRALRIAIDGPEAGVMETGTHEAVVPVPMVDVDKLRPLMSALMRDVQAMAVVFADRNGKVLTFDGAAGYVDKDLLAAGLAPGFGGTMKLLPVIGEQPRVMKYYDGGKFDLYSLAVGLHHFIILIYEGNADRAIGNVKNFGGKAVNKMLEMIGDVAFALKPPAPPVQAKPEAGVPAEQPSSRRGKRKTQTQEIAAVQPGRQSVSAPREQAASPSQPALEPILNFDPNILAGLDNVDLSKANDLFDPDKLAADLQGGPGNRISFEDALTQGIIGNIED